MSVAELAKLGGPPVFDPPLYWSDLWPPVTDTGEARLIALYRSRRWTAFDAPEGRFAAAFATHHDAAHGIFMMNGTVTLQCALAAFGIGPGDEVIVPALTWYATASAARYLGATPVFVDVEADTLCLDTTLIEAAITERTRAIIPVHLYGSMADIDAVLAIAQRHNLRVIEDCAHAHGGRWLGRALGSFGDVGSFSFQQSKTMASAEGGICITNDPGIAERIFRLKHIGYAPADVQRYVTDRPATDLTCYPFRATAFQAVLLEDQLPTLDARLSRYGKSARYLEERLALTTRVRIQKRGRLATCQSYYGLALMFDDPSYACVSIDALRDAIAAEGILLMNCWGAVYDFPLFNFPRSTYRISDRCPVAESAGRQVLWLHHAYLGLDDAVLDRIVEVIDKVLGQVARLKRT